MTLTSQRFNKYELSYLRLPITAPRLHVYLPIVSEVFPFVEHSCRFGPEGCQVQAGNCAEYTRLRDCCCHSYLASVCKRRNSAQR